MAHSARVAWLLWAFTGLFGGHLFYLGRKPQGLLALFTLNVLGIGWICDAFYMTAYLETAEEGPPPYDRQPSNLASFTPQTQTRASAPVDASQDSVRPSPSQSSRNPDASLFTPSASVQDIEDAPEDAADGKEAGDDVELTIEDEAATPSQEPDIVRKGSLTPGLSTLEWAQKMKAQAAEEQRLRDQEKYAGLSPQEIEAREQEERAEAERVARQDKLRKRQLMGYSHVKTSPPGSGRGRGLRSNSITGASPSPGGTPKLPS